MIALQLDRAAWTAEQLRLHGREVSIDQLRDAIARVAGEAGTPHIQHFRKFFEHNSDREFPARLERAWVLVTGGEHLRVHHEQSVYGLNYRPRSIQRREILAGLEA